MSERFNCLNITPTNNGRGETTEFHHPDRTGTKLVTNNAANSSFEQSTLPFGTALDAETTGSTNQRFTSYDKSTIASLDYAVNRSYSAGQSRFTSVDPIGMDSVSIGNPQSMNLYAYVQNNPIDFTDPSGLFKAAPKTLATVTIVDNSRAEMEAMQSLLSLIMFSREIMEMPSYDAGEVGVVDVFDGGPDPVTEGQVTRTQLSPCLRNYLRQFFPTEQIGKKTYSPVDDARFISGMPFYARNQTAITLGLYDIHYKPANGFTGLDLTGGQDGSSIGILAEEIAHAVQFMQIWRGIQNSFDSIRSSAPTYFLAQDRWKEKYLKESARIFASLVVAGVPFGKANSLSYDLNKYEIAAKQKRTEVEDNITNIHGGKNPCP